MDCKDIKPVNPKENQSWIFIGRTDDEAETPIFWPPDLRNWLIGKRPWCWERLKAGWEEEDRGWDGWMASPTQWTWVWTSYRGWWWAGKPGVLQSMGSQEVDTNEQPNWAELLILTSGPVLCCFPLINLSLWMCFLASVHTWQSWLDAEYHECHLAGSWKFWYFYSLSIVIICS